MRLSGSAQRIRDTPNAGGSSVVSEVLSFEVLQRCFGASLLKTEMEVEYFPAGGSITDYTCSIFNTAVGVSVTRAMKYKGQYELADAQHLLNKKLRGIVRANRNTLEKWDKQILHVWATSQRVAQSLTQALDSVHCDVISNTVILITVAQTTPEIFANS